MTADLTITLRLFAQVRVAAGAATVERRVPSGSTAGDVARALLEELGLSGMAGQVVLAIDAEFARPDVVLSDGDWLSIVPPVSGGAGPVIDVVVTEGPLDIAAALAVVADRAAGGTVLFQGTPRDVDALEFEAHEALAQAELARIGADLVSRHGLTGIALHHRLGLVPATEAAIVVVAASPRRGAAFDAARAALDEVKRRVPIWKAEVVGEERALVEGQVVEGVPTLAAQPQVSTADRLTHVAPDGSARMVDVTGKAVTDRLARATATVRMSPATAQLVADGSGPKGEVLATARLAGVLAAKRTAELVPLAHPLPLSKIDVQAEVDVATGRVRLEGFAKTTGKTGVEIEALTAVLIAALTVYDMIKAVERHAVIEGVQVLQKEGGRHDFVLSGGGAAPGPAAAPGHAPAPRALQVGAVHVSTTRTRGVRPDRSREALAGFCARTGWVVAHEEMVPDDRDLIATAIRAAAATGVEAVLTLGGTGLTEDDLTPEATRDAIDREIPGIAEGLRAASREFTPMAALSRATAGALGGAVVVNLPGSPKALAELEPLLTAVLPHAVDQIRRGLEASTEA
ncbi:MAG: bifunctional molybdenum cofactor biosynthesis protein MoaC/MoaB [Solirubrobacteraceae bacterium]|nr:bifunctional molybdenum cofactor biosynthesis protein MoaC/MoaB [Solirubrobacteraceae bacterium]